MPFCLQPEKHYVGVAWYQRDIEIPGRWQGKRVVLTLERVHWGSQVWLDAKAVGADTSLSTPHRYDLGLNVAPGKHRLTLRIDNRMLVNVGSWAHSVSDHTQGNWNGVVGRIELSASSPVWIEDVQVYPDVAKKSAVAKARIGNATGVPGHGTLTLGDSRSRSVGGKPARPSRRRSRSGTVLNPGTNSVPPSRHSRSGSRANTPMTSGP